MQNKNSKNINCGIISLVLFGLLFILLSSSYFFSLDSWINMNIQGLWNNTLNSIVIFLTNIWIPLFILFSVLIIIYFIYKKRRQEASLFLVSVSIGVLFVQLLKLFFHKVRPYNSMIIENNYSFPSSHAAVSLIFSLIVLYLFRDEIKNKVKRYFFYSICIILPLFIGFSRVYLNVHWFSDIIAGFVAALFYVSFVLIIATKLKFKNKHRNLNKNGNSASK